jgi:hypothetical protein
VLYETSLAWSLVDTDRAGDSERGVCESPVRLFRFACDIGVGMTQSINTPSALTRSITPGYGLDNAKKNPMLMSIDRLFSHGEVLDTETSISIMEEPKSPLLKASKGLTSTFKGFCSNGHENVSVGIY